MSRRDIQSPHCLEAADRRDVGTSRHLPVRRRGIANRRRAADASRPQPAAGVHAGVAAQRGVPRRCGERPGDRPALIDEAKRLATKLRVKHLELRHDVQASAGSDDPDLKGKELYVAFDCAISTNDESLMKMFPPDLRRMIRIGVKNELTTEFGREALLDEFYDVYAASVHRLGSPVFPKRLFAACLKSYGDECDIMMIRKDGRVAGTVLSFFSATRCSRTFGVVSGVQPRRHQQFQCPGN